MPEPAVIHCTSPDRMIPPPPLESRFHLALIDDRNGLESPMRVIADPTTMLRGREVRGPGIVQEKEWRELGTKVVVRKDGTNGKTVTDPVNFVLALFER